METPNSFASQFHRQLKAKCGYKGPVVARTEYVGVNVNGKKMTTMSIKEEDRKWRRKAPGSKVKFTWMGDTQQRELVYSEDD